MIIVVGVLINFYPSRNCWLLCDDKIITVVTITWLFALNLCFTPRVDSTYSKTFSISAWFILLPLYRLSIFLESPFLITPVEIFAFSLPFLLALFAIVFISAIWVWSLDWLAIGCAGMNDCPEYKACLWDRRFISTVQKYWLGALLFGFELFVRFIPSFLCFVAYSLTSALQNSATFCRCWAVPPAT